MQIPILVEPLSDGRFRAKAGEPFAIHADGPTAGEALRSVEKLLSECVSKGAYWAAVNVPNPNGVPRVLTGNSLSPENSLVDEEFFRDLREEMAENRRLEDEGSCRLSSGTGGK